MQAIVLLVSGLWMMTPSLFGAERRYDPAMRPPVIHDPPGPEYADDWRMFQGIPTIERTRTGRLWAAWYAGGATEDPFNYVPLVTSADDGHTWSEPKLVLDIPDFGRTWDPNLWLDPDGRLWFFWTQSVGHWDGRGGVWCMVSQNPGAERPRWSKPRRLADGVMLNKPIVLRNGAWLLPVAMWPQPPNIESINKRHMLGLSAAAIQALTFEHPDRGLSMVYASRDKGKTFQRIGHAVIPDVGHNEHMLIERRDGSLWMLARTAYGIAESFSSDGGKTWTVGRNSGIPHPVARFHIRRLNSGNLLLVRHNSPMPGKTGMKPRTHLTAYLSEDDGRTWLGGLLLDDRTAVSYPDAAPASDGRIFVIYDHNRHSDREILMAVFREEDARAGRAVSTGVRLRVLVNKGAKDR